MEKKFHTLKVAVTLKIGSRSPKSNQLVSSSQQCICASLVKICPSVQKITHRNEATRTPTQTPTGSAPKTICPPPLRLGGHNSFNHQEEEPVLKLSLVMRKPAFCICENKDADQLRGNRKADQRLCFRHIDSTIPLFS